MRTDKKIKEYSDSKMQILKDDEFFNSVVNEHFTKSQKPKSTWKSVMSVVASFVIVFIVVLTVTLIVQGNNEYYNGQYEIKQSTLKELNEDCRYYFLTEDSVSSVDLTVERATQKKLFYDVKMQLNDGTDCFSFICIIDNDYDYMFGSYECNKQYGAYTINYNITSEYDTDEKVFKHKVSAALLTDKERIDIRYVGKSLNENNMFFELLSEILISR